MAAAMAEGKHLAIAFRASLGAGQGQDLQVLVGMAFRAFGDWGPSTCP